MRAADRPVPWSLALSLVLVACTPTKGEVEAKREPDPKAQPKPGPLVEFEPVDPPAPLTGPATQLSFDAEAPPMWFDNPACNSRYARAETLHLRLPESVDVDVERLHALREFSNHTVVWTADAGRHLVEAPAAGTRSRVRWRLEPGAPVELWVIDANPSPEGAESCWDAVEVHGTVELESADGSLAITTPVRFFQLMPTSTRVLIHGTVEAFGLGFAPSTAELDPNIELHLDLPVAEPRSLVPKRMDPRGLTPIEVQLFVTVDKSAMIGGKQRQVRGMDFLAVSEESPEARELLGEPEN
jgi:hypothetical protein